MKNFIKGLVRSGKPEPVKLMEKLAKGNDSVLIRDGFGPSTFEFEVTKDGTTSHGKILSVNGKWKIQKLG